MVNSSQKGSFGLLCTIEFLVARSLRKGMGFFLKKGWCVLASRWLIGIAVGFFLHVCVGDFVSYSYLNFVRGRLVHVRSPCLLYFSLYAGWSPQNNNPQRGSTRKQRKSVPSTKKKSNLDFFWREGDAVLAIFFCYFLDHTFFFPVYRTQFL